MLFHATRCRAASPAFGGSLRDREGASHLDILSFEMLCAMSRKAVFSSVPEFGR